MLQVAVFCSQGRNEDSHPNADCRQPHKKQGEKQHHPGRLYLGSPGNIKHKYAREQGELNAHFYQVGEYSADGNRKAREIHFPKDAGVGEKNRGRGIKVAGEESPEHGSGKKEEGMGDFIRSYSGKVSKDEGEHNGGNNGLDDKPQRPQDGLLEFCYKVPLYKKENQVPVADQFADL